MLSPMSFLFLNFLVDSKPVFSAKNEENMDGSGITRRKRLLLTSASAPRP